MILIVGAGGFVGRSLTAELLRRGFDVVVAVREVSSLLPAQVEQVIVSELSVDTKWLGIINKRIETIIYLAARVHVMNDYSEDPLSEYRKINTLAPINLAKQASELGVKRFIYISSIKVNGEKTLVDKPFTVDDVIDISNIGFYGLSKYEAEQELLRISDSKNMDVVIIRPPLIYGPNVKGNFRSLLKLVYKNIPLPLGAIRNNRSLLALDNLNDFIINCVVHPKAANQIFLISDNEDISTFELVKKMAYAFNKTPCLVPIPVGVLIFFAKVIGKQGVLDRLVGSLQLDSSKARDLLGWKPVVTIDEELKKTVDAFLNEKNI